MPSDEALQKQAEEWKQKGNDAFGSGQLDAAVTAYSQGIVACDRLLTSTNSDSNNSSASLKATLWSNRAMCSLKLSNFQDCIDDCNSALLDTTTSTKNSSSLEDVSLRNKLLYRRAKARFMLANNNNNDKGDSKEMNNNNSNIEELLQEAAKDLLVLLQTDPTNSQATQLLHVVRNQHKLLQKAVTPVSKTIAALKQENNDNDNDRWKQLQLLRGLLDHDLVNAATELGRIDDAVPLLLEIAANDEKDDEKQLSAVLAMQCLSAASAHPPFVRQHMVSRQTDLVRVIAAAAADFNGDNLVVSCLAAYVRILLHADRDDPETEITGDTQLDYAAIVQAMVCALGGGNNDKNDATATTTSTTILRAVLDVLSTWTATERDSAIRAALTVPDPTLPTPKTPQEVRAMTPPQLAAYKKRQYEIKTRNEAWAYERAHYFICSSTGSFQTLLRAACACHNHVVRREMTVGVGRLLAAGLPDGDSNEKMQQALTPFLQDDAAVRRGDDEAMIEEVYNEDGDEEQQEKEETTTTSLETKMERALITSALLLSRKDMGAWALTGGGGGWADSSTELPALIHSGDKRAMCLASEVLAAAATGVEAARGMVTALISSNSGNMMEQLMMSDDRDIRSGAASAVAKLGLSEKSSDEGDIMGLLQAACDLLEDNRDDGDDGAAAKIESSKNSKTKGELKHFSSYATSSVERAIEMLTYLVANTVVKEELAAGFAAHLDSPNTALELLVKTADLPLAGESLSGFGLATIFQNMAATNEQIRKEAFEGKEVTMEQYDEMQRMGKTEEEKELMDKEKDTDTPAGCSERIRKMAGANVPRALVALTEGASEHTLEQLVLGMNRIADEASVRGIMIQQGVLSACIKVEKTEGPTETDVMKKVIRLARHCIAKLLITTNPSLLTSAQRLGSVKPLIQLVRDIKASDLQHFEALLAVTNIGSAGEDAVNRIVTEKGIPSFHFAMFSDHEMVRRAATEAMCNLVPHKAMMEHLAKEENLRLWLAFAIDYEENYECARAATGCLAMATQDETIAKAIVELEKFQPEMSALLESGRLEIMHRALCIVLNLVMHGSETRDKAIEAGLVAFCRAYIELQSHSKNDLEFSEQERQLLPITVDLGKKIVQSADETS